eukprot:1798798-Alexandrium_andersonii.AAC.1
MLQVGRVAGDAGLLGSYPRSGLLSGCLQAAPGCRQASVAASAAASCHHSRWFAAWPAPLRVLPHPRVPSGCSPLGRLPAVHRRRSSASSRWPNSSWGLATAAA